MDGLVKIASNLIRERRHPKVSREMMRMGVRESMIKWMHAPDEEEISKAVDEAIEQAFSDNAMP